MYNIHLNSNKRVSENRVTQNEKELRKLREVTTLSITYGFCELYCSPVGLLHQFIYSLYVDEIEDLWKTQIDKKFDWSIESRSLIALSVYGVQTYNVAYCTMYI